MPFPIANTLLTQAAQTRLLSLHQNDGGCQPTTLTLRPAAENQKLVVITGLNATGKSLLRRLIGHAFQKQGGNEVMHLSMEKRTEGDVVGALMFGSEQDQSTGCITTHSSLTGIRTSRSKTTAPYKSPISVWRTNTWQLPPPISLNTARKTTPT